MGPFLSLGHLWLQPWHVPDGIPGYSLLDSVSSGQYADGNTCHSISAKQYSGLHLIVSDHTQLRRRWGNTLTIRAESLAGLLCFTASVKLASIDLLIDWLDSRFCSIRSVDRLIDRLRAILTFQASNHFSRHLAVVDLLDLSGGCGHPAAAVHGVQDGPGGRHHQSLPVRAGRLPRPVHC